MSSSLVGRGMCQRKLSNGEIDGMLLKEWLSAGGQSHQFEWQRSLDGEEMDGGK